MTREEAKEYLPIMQAFAEGKTIQYLDDRGFWNDIKTCVSFDYNISCYRIKPEPKYRPFKSHEECWNEARKHNDFGWIKNSNELIHICNIFKANDNVIIDFHSDLHYTINVVKVFNKYTFTDGTPFGIKEE